MILKKNINLTLALYLCCGIVNNFYQGVIFLCKDQLGFCAASLSSSYFSASIFKSCYSHQAATHIFLHIFRHQSRPFACFVRCIKLYMELRSFLAFDSRRLRCLHLGLSSLMVVLLVFLGPPLDLFP